MNACGGAPAESAAHEEPEEDSEWSKHLRAELAAALRRCVATNARLGLLLRGGDGADLGELAKAADEGSLAAGQVAGFAKLLLRAGLPILLLSSL